MGESQFRVAIVTVALAFTGLFCVVVVPPLIENPDVLGAFAAGFVNPYSSGYSADVIACWMLLAIWVIHEAHSRSVKNGWVCLVLGIVPGVAVGLAAYLLLRSMQQSASMLCMLPTQSAQLGPMCTVPQEGLLRQR